MMKKLFAGLGTVALAGSMLLIGPMAASATEECIPSDAWTEVISEAVPAVPAVDEVSHTAYQRYSWTKPQNQEADNPQTTPPGDDWQANTTNYAGAGHGTDPIGEAFDAGTPGNGDWFFWTATKVIDTPASPEIPAVPAVTKDHPAVTCEPPAIITTQCESTSVFPTSTNLNQHGWVLKPDTAEYVPGGVQLTSTAWDGGKVTLATNFKLSEAGAVAIDYTQGPGSGSVALLFNTSDGNQIHYEPFVGYTHPWFADEVGVFPLGGGGQGSDWSAPDLTTLVSDPTITSVVVGVWGGESDVVTVHSARFNCATHAFDFEKAVVVVPPVETPKVVTPVKTLAYTGSNDANHGVNIELLPLGLAGLAVGGVLLYLRRKFAW